MYAPQTRFQGLSDKFYTHNSVADMYCSSFKSEELTRGMSEIEKSFESRLKLKIASAHLCAVVKRNRMISNPSTRQ